MNGSTKTVAIAIGPEFSTVGPEFIRDAAKEAAKFADLLVVCVPAPSRALVLTSAVPPVS